MRRHALFLVLCAACGGGSRVAQPSVPVDVTADARVHRYRFAWSYQSAHDVTVPAVDGELDLRGELTMRVVPGDDTRVVIAIERLDHHAMRLLGEELLPDAASLVGREVLVTIARDAEVEVVEIAADTAPLARHLLTRLVAHLDLPAMLAERDPSSAERTLDVPERFELAQLDAVRDVGRPAILDATRVEVALDVAFDENEAARAMAERFAGALVIGDVELVVAAVGDGFVPRPTFAIEATGLLRAWPEQAEPLADAFARARDAGARSLVLDLLASAGTPQAQAVMLRALDRDETRDDPAYASYLQRPGFVAHPSAELAAFVLEAHERAADLGEHDTRCAALYAMGAVARGVEDAPVAAALHERIVDELEHAEDDTYRVAALAGLGNLGDVEDLDRVLAAFEAESASVRTQAASSLRWMPREEAIDGLLPVLDDPDPAVAREALRVLDRYVLAEHDAAPLVHAVAAHAYHDVLASRLVDVLRRRLDQDPQVAMGLVTLASSEPDALIALRASAV